MTRTDKYILHVVNKWEQQCVSILARMLAILTKESVEHLYKINRINYYFKSMYSFSKSSTIDPAEIGRIPYKRMFQKNEGICYSDSNSGINLVKKIQSKVCLHS